MTENLNPATSLLSFRRSTPHFLLERNINPKRYSSNPASELRISIHKGIEFRVRSRAMHRVFMEKYERPTKQLRRPEAARANVRLWHIADIDADDEHVCFWG